MSRLDYGRDFKHEARTERTARVFGRASAVYLPLKSLKHGVWQYHAQADDLDGLAARVRTAVPEDFAVRTGAVSEAVSTQPYWMRVLVHGAGTLQSGGYFAEARLTLGLGADVQEQAYGVLQGEGIPNVLRKALDRTRTTLESMTAHRRE